MSPMNPMEATAGKVPATRPSFWTRVEEALERAGDRLNPILVKETRQALKSRQFLITFVLVLAACWVWSLLGIAMIGPRVYYSSEAPSLFFAYYIILTFPLTLIIPFTAYRSLAGEREDNTYELLSITTLSPRQIISGKLGSAAIQVIVYFSAVAPCLAFTYLLRGIDIITIGLLLYYAFFGSLGLSMIGLFLATITRQKYLQVLVSVILVLGLALVFWLNVAMAWQILAWGSSQMVHQTEFWIFNGVVLTIYLTTFALVFLAAAGQLTFPSENRSTALRWAMFLQHACVGAWMSVVLLVEAFEPTAVVALMTILGIYWYLMGAMMTGESLTISERVHRSLPRSFFGRTFLTWFNPGPFSGYLFAMANLVGGTVCALIGLAVAWLFDQGNPNLEDGLLSAAFFAILVTAYAAFFLGIGNLVLTWLRRFVQVEIFTALIIQILILLTFTFVPLVIQLMSTTIRNEGYTLLQITNPFWTLEEIGGRSMPNSWLVTLGLLSSVPLLGLVAFAANIPGVLREVRRLRIADPARVIEEDAELSVVPSQPTSPWDE